MNTQLLGKATLAIAIIGLSFGEVSATDRAGTAKFLAGTAGIVVNLNPPMPDANYAVSVQPTATGNYSPTTDCTYFNVYNKTANHFKVQHKTCAGGAGAPLVVDVSLDWQVSARTAILGQPCGGGTASCSYHEHCGIPGAPLVCVDDSISDGSCTKDSNCTISGLSVCVGTASCGTNFCYSLCP